MNKKTREQILSASLVLGFAFGSIVFVISISNNVELANSILAYALSGLLFSGGTYLVLKILVLAITGAMETMRLLGRPGYGQSRYGGPERDFNMAGEPPVLPQVQEPDLSSIEGTDQYGRVTRSKNDPKSKPPPEPSGPRVMDYELGETKQFPDYDQ
ncbi:MAG: hypothetical protein R3251_02475 [Candidatus Spechtbacterales bacterium]|nr:hypothetical protein [Candidatus Spechtbacterales bacterium]